MQYHLNGVSTGDPGISEPRQPAQNPNQVDVLIIGSKPAGLTLAAQL